MARARGRGAGVRVPIAGVLLAKVDVLAAGDCMVAFMLAVMLAVILAAGVNVVVELMDACAALTLPLKEALALNEASSCMDASSLMEVLLAAAVATGTAKACLYAAKGERGARTRVRIGTSVAGKRSFFRIPEGEEGGGRA